jgi:hypothetical protein
MPGISLPPGGAEALRRALLQRIADRLAYARAFDEGELEGFSDCCWIHFEWPTRPPYRYPMHRYAHRICGEDCPHWHHWVEVLYG